MGTWDMNAAASQELSCADKQNQNTALTNPVPFWLTPQTGNAFGEQRESVTLREGLLNLTWADVDFDRLLIKWGLFFMATLNLSSTSIDGHQLI